MKLIYAAITVLLFVAALPSFAQEAQPCPSRGCLSPHLIARALQLDAERGGGNEVRTLKLKVVIATTVNDQGTQVLAVKPSRVQADLDVTNEIMARCNTGIRFQLCGAIRTVEDIDLFYNGNIFGPAVEEVIEQGYITAFYTLQTSFGGTGFAAGDRICVTTSASPSVLAHELGHVLGLNHTMDNIIEPELVDGTNCAIGGDMLCDTPADPNLSLPDMVAPSCTYVGTVTDANGDLYMPMMNNVMSYSPCRTDTLTPQQGAVMRMVADEVRSYLRRTSNPIDIAPFNWRQCANASSLQLSATPAPGAFAGPNVNGSTLVNAPNTPGEYFVQYTPTTPPEPPTELIDQLMLPPGFGTSSHIAENTDSVWQSFRSSLDGTFLRLEFYTHATAPQTMRMRLFEGTGVAGNLLHDTTAVAGTDTSWTSFFLPPGFTSIAGNTYTALLTSTSALDVFRPAGVSYAYGESSLFFPGIDLEFRQWVFATPPCQETTRYYALYEVPDRPISNLPDAYCHSDDRTVQLTVDPRLITGSAIQLDGEALSTFTPAALAMGDHLARHIYTINGCTDTLEQVFAVEPPPTFAFPNLTAPTCTTDEPFVIDADPSGGYFRINGVRDSLLAPADLGVGTHTIDYVYSTLLDTVDFMDQACCFEGFPAYHQLMPDSFMWQSFTAQQSGDLVILQTGILFLSNDPRTFEVIFLAGTGLDGQVLWSDTRTTTDGYNALFSNTGLVVEQGSTYTFAFHYLPDDVPLPLPEVLHITGNGYANGEGYVPGIQAPVDLYFSEMIRQRFPCADSTSFSISVEVCTGITDNLLPGMYVAPVPFNDRLVLNTGTDAVRLAMHAADGRLLFTGSALPYSTHALPVADLPAGCYMLRVSGLTGERTEVLKLVKE